MTVVENLGRTLLDLDPEQLAAFVRDHPGDPVVEAALRLVTGTLPLLPHQRPPHDDWKYWLLLGGRFAGKTQAGAYDLNRHMLGPPCDPRIPGGHRAAIIAPTHDDAADSCMNGPSGLLTLNPDVRLVTRKGGTVALWPNGAVARLFGAFTPEDAERLRAGGNRCRVWAEEFAAWRQMVDCWTHMKFGLRIGPDPRVVITTTPKPRSLLRQVVADERTVVTHGRSADNPFIAQQVREELYETYGGTYLGRQELDGLLIAEAQGALWKLAWIDEHRTAVTERPDLARVVVGVDPSGSDSDGADEQGIVVAARGVDSHLYVLADRSCKLTPEGWGRRAVEAYREHAADLIVVERNYGGQMAEATVKQAAAAMGETVRVKMVNATRGKVIRAEPISALYEQGKAHHPVDGSLDVLEQQMVEWEPESGWSPDRVDALVWAATELRAGVAGNAVAAVPTGRLARRAAPLRTAGARRF